MNNGKALLFASHNAHKLNEVRAILGQTIPIISLSDIGFTDELPETHNTLKENALEKAEFVYNKTGKDCFAEDTGLEIDALGGEPGVRTARYAGEDKNALDNMGMVLQKMKDITNRAASFRTVIAFIQQGKTIFFEGRVLGTISRTMGGNKGFGYDPIFMPNGFNTTFAEIEPDVKNTISHRAKAFGAFKAFLKELNVK